MKEDDMDEMLRKAAEHYEVDADKAADWNAVYNAVHTPEEAMPETENRKKRRFAFWWLLLIPIGWIANTEYNKFKDAQNHAASKEPAAVIEQKASKPQQPVTESNSVSADNTIDKSVTINNNQKSQNASSYKKPLPEAIPHTTVNYNLNKQNSLQQFQQATSKPVTDQQPVANATVINNSNVVTDSANNQVSNTSPQIAQQNNLSALNTIDSSQKQSSLVTASPSLIKKPKANMNHFYAGIMAGADLSFIKYQDIEPLGYNVGLLVGYKFRKLSIESGLYFDKKNYYTSGEYFDKSGIAYFDDAQILTVDGYCKMFEIPLNLKYNISEKKRHIWFVGAGLSSYLMNKEFYNYDYIKNGMQHNGSRAYYNASQNWFSILNINAGYELRTGQKTNLRIEPYYKASLSGLGTGNLSISSIGINAGIVRRIP